LHFLSLIPPSFLSSVSLFAFPFIIHLFCCFPLFICSFFSSTCPCSSVHFLQSMSLPTSCLTRPTYVTILYTFRTWQNAHGSLLAWKKSLTPRVPIAKVLQEQTDDMCCAANTPNCQGVPNWQCLQDYTALYVQDSGFESPLTLIKTTQLLCITSTRYQNWMLNLAWPWKRRHYILQNVGNCLPSTRRTIPENLNFYQHRCENLESRSA
jgi:hypothetical protein